MSTSFGLDRPWRLADRVALREERFGALLYHFGTRRLSFIKSRQLLAVVRGLADHPSVRAACAAAGVTDSELPACAKALAVLANRQMISERPAV
ncbi:MAG TPA: mycofactocin biosynthesis chaperone MftB [Streptosporangiaceae bacterium]|nr:mycofactocin biosynthesis chaperone MftB [Streptosporangiaceae bacterium]